MDVSVIIPVYNAETFVEKAVYSAVTLQEVKEIILVEDASSDDSYAICKKLVHTFPKVHLFRHPDAKNHGAGASRNLGIEKAIGPYIAFLDADDFFLPHRFLKDKITFKNHTKIDGVYNAVGVHYYSEKAKEIYKQTTGTPDLITLSEEISSKKLAITLLRGSLGNISIDGLTIKKSALKHIRFIEKSFAEDTDFLIRLASQKKLYASNLSEAVTQRGIHETNHCTQLNQMLDAYPDFIKNLYNWAQKEQLADASLSVLIHQLFQITQLQQEAFLFKRLYLLLSVTYFPLFFKEHILRSQFLKALLGKSSLRNTLIQLKRKRSFRLD